MIYNVCEYVLYRADRWQTCLTTIRGLGVHTAKKCRGTVCELLRHDMQTVVTTLYSSCYGTVLLPIACYSPRNGNHNTISLLRWHCYVFICMKTAYFMLDQKNTVCINRYKKLMLVSKTVTIPNSRCGKTVHLPIKNTSS